MCVQLTSVFRLFPTVIAITLIPTESTQQNTILKTLHYIIIPELSPGLYSACTCFIMPVKTVHNSVGAKYSSPRFP